MLQVPVLMAWLLASDIERVYMHASVCSASRALHRLHRLARHHQLVPCIANARCLAVAASRILPCVELLTSPLPGVTATAVDASLPRSPAGPHRDTRRCPTISPYNVSLRRMFYRTIRQKHTRPCTRYSFDFDYPFLARRSMRAAHMRVLRDDFSFYA